MVTQAQSGKRSLPVNARTLTVLQAAERVAGVTATVTSGGQTSQATGTGSTRHNLSVGAADVTLSLNGRLLSFNNPQDRPYFERFITAAHDAGATGFGAGTGYMGPNTIHVGFGAPNIWGAGGRTANAPSWLKNVAMAFVPTAAQSPAALAAAVEANPNPNVRGQPHARRSKTIAATSVQQGAVPAWVKPGERYTPPAAPGSKSGGPNFGYAISADGRTTRYQNSAGKTFVIQRDPGIYGFPAVTPSGGSELPLVGTKAASAVPTARAGPAKVSPAKAAEGPAPVQPGKAAPTLLAQALSEAGAIPQGPLSLGPLLSAQLSGDQTKIAAAGTAVKTAWDASPPGTSFALPGQLSAFAKELSVSAPHAFAYLKDDPNAFASIPKDYAGYAPIIGMALKSVTGFKLPAEPASLGSSGFTSEVAGLQKLFAASGIDVGPIDGIFGEKTLNAAQLFMRQNPARAAAIKARLDRIQNPETNLSKDTITGAILRLSANTNAPLFGTTPTRLPSPNYAYKSAINTSSGSGSNSSGATMFQPPSSSPSYTPLAASPNYATKSTANTKSSTIASSAMRQPTVSSPITDAAGRILGGI